MMLKRLRIIPVVLLLTLAFAQCQKPSFVLGQKKMAEVTKDMLLTDAYIQHSYPPDSVAALYYESVLEKYGISREQYDSSVVWYSENAYRLADIYALVEKELTETKNLTDTFLADSLHRYRIRFEHPSLENGNLWANSTRLVIPAKTTLWAYSQSVSPIEAFEPSDTIRWSADFIGTPPDSLSLSAQLLIVSELGYRYQKISNAATIQGQRWESTFVLPDSLPTSPRYTLTLLLRKSTNPLRLQHISLGKPQIPQTPSEGQVQMTEAEGSEANSELEPLSQAPE